MSKVLGIVNRSISTHLIKKAGFKATQAQTGAVTLIQRFGSALNLNVHFHMLFIDGVYQEKHNGQLRFHRVNAATTSELNTLVATHASALQVIWSVRVYWCEMMKTVI
jgi:hypothetical protein